MAEYYGLFDTNSDAKVILVKFEVNADETFQTSLSALNDIDNCSFDQIADVIEYNFL